MADTGIKLEDIVQQPEIKIMGMSADMRGSQKENSRLIRELWENFDANLWKIENRIEQPIGFKYGATYNSIPGGQFTYLAGVEVHDLDSIPDGMIGKTLLALEYAHFCHRGNFRNLSDTIFNIYNKWLPDSGYNLVPAWQCGVSHYERYDRHFQWVVPKSEIDIFLPVCMK